MWCVMCSNTHRIHQIEKVYDGIYRPSEPVGAKPLLYKVASQHPPNPKRTIHTYIIMLRCYIRQVTYVVSLFENIINKFGS